MILTETVKLRILENGLSLELAKALECSQAWIIRLAKANRKNGPLTTLIALKVIREYTGLSDSEILTEVVEVAGQK